MFNPDKDPTNGNCDDMDAVRNSLRTWYSKNWLEATEPFPGQLGVPRMKTEILD